MVLCGDVACEREAIRMLASVSRSSQNCLFLTQSHTTASTTITPDIRINIGGNTSTEINASNQTASDSVPGDVLYRVMVVVSTLLTNDDCYVQRGIASFINHLTKQNRFVECLVSRPSIIEQMCRLLDQNSKTRQEENELMSRHTKRQLMESLSRIANTHGPQLNIQVLNLLKKHASGF